MVGSTALARAEKSLTILAVTSGPTASYFPKLKCSSRCWPRGNAEMIGRRIKAAIAGFLESPKAITELQQQNEILLAQEHELRERNRHFDAALSNMAQGLCMF